jgi:hypothetical protein
MIYDYLQLNSKIAGDIVDGLWNRTNVRFLKLGQVGLEKTGKPSVFRISVRNRFVESDN